MDNLAYQWSSWHPLILRNASWAFVLEVLVRTFITYVLLIISKRSLARRTASRFALFEICILMASIATIVVPLRAGDRGILSPIMILLVALILHRLVAWQATCARQSEPAIATNLILLVRDGRLEYNSLRHAALSRAKVFEAIRINGWQHLGQISRMYVEPSGKFSFIAAVPSSPGLSVLPSVDEDLRQEGRVIGYVACSRCGQLVNTEAMRDAIGSRRCNVCGSVERTYAVTELEHRSVG